MVTSLHWLLLLWGIQGLCAQDYEEDYEEEVVVTPKRKVNQFASNTIPRNGNGKSKVFSFLEFVSGLFVPLMLLLWKVVWSLCRWHMFHFFLHHQKKKGAATGEKNRTRSSTRTLLEDAIHLDWSYLLGLPEPSISYVTVQCSVTQMFYSLRILFPQAHSLCDIFPRRLMWIILSPY